MQSLLTPVGQSIEHPLGVRVQRVWFQQWRRAFDDAEKSVQQNWVAGRCGINHWAFWHLVKVMLDSCWNLHRFFPVWRGCLLRMPSTLAYRLSRRSLGFLARCFRLVRLVQPLVNSPDDFSSLLSLPRIIVNALQKQNLSANWLLEPPRKFGKTVFTKYRSAFN